MMIRGSGHQKSYQNCRPMRSPSGFGPIAPIAMCETAPAVLPLVKELPAAGPDQISERGTNFLVSMTQTGIAKHL